MHDRSNTFRKARLHMDATRSAGLFAQRMILVEGISDAVILRQLGAVWADDAIKEGFVDALTITVIGWKNGRWPVDVLATPGYEIVDRVGFFTDTDTRTGDVPSPPAWMERPPFVRAFRNHPTLEPSVTTGNEDAVGAALDVMGIVRPVPLDAGGIDTLFQGSAKSRKVEFSLELAARFAQRLADREDVFVPAHIAKMFDYLYEDPVEDDVVTTAGTGDSAPRAY